MFTKSSGNNMRVVLGGGGGGGPATETHLIWKENHPPL